MKIPIPITATVLALTAATALAGCAPDPTHESGAATASSVAPEAIPSKPGDNGRWTPSTRIPVAGVGAVDGHCEVFISIGGDSWVLPPTGVGQLVWAPSAKDNACVILPGQVPVAVTPAAGAPAVAPVADYVILGGHCTVTIKTSGGTVWAMPDSGLGELTRVTEPATVACRKAVN